MKNNILYILFLLPAILSSQTLSIQDLWNKLAETNILKQKQLDLQIARQELAIEKLNRYPVVYGEANLQRNLIIPTTPVPAIAFDPKAQDGVILPLKFATKWNAKAGIQAEWNIFDPKQSKLIKEKKLLAEKTEINKKIELQSIKKDATLAYASIVLASLQHQIAVEDSANYEQILQIVKNRFEAGRENSEQYYTALQEFERKKIQRFETWSILQEADYELQKYIDLYSIKQLSSDIESITTALIDYKTNDFESQLINIDIELNENDIQEIKRQVLPKLTVNAYYGSQYFNNKLNFSNSNWFGNSYTNLAIKLPLSAHITKKSSIIKSSLERQLFENKLIEINKNEKIQNNQKLQKVAAHENKVESLKKIIQLSQANIDTQKIEFEAGKKLISDYNKALTTHNNNLKELWQTQYELIEILLN